MDKNTGVSDINSSSYKNNVVWGKLYHFLEIRVRCWVYSNHLSLWRGQAEEVTADIIQDAVVGTLTYTQQWSQWNWEKEVISSSWLQYIGAVIAYKHYQKQRCYAARFVSVRLHSRLAQGFFTERVDPLEIVLTSTFYEWYCEHLVRVIAKIPVRLRDALLVRLANRTRFGAQLTLLLQSRFLQRNIDLYDYYQRPLPRNLQERSEHEALLQLAYGQIMKKQKQENNELLSECAEFSGLESAEMYEAEHDPELVGLIEHLKAHAPSPRPDISLRETLRDKILEAQLEHQISQKTAAISAQAVEALVLPNTAAETNNDGESALSNNLDIDDSEADPELAVLAAYLDAKARSALIDPIFREALREKLKKVEGTNPPFTVVEDALDATEKFLGQLPPEFYPARFLFNSFKEFFWGGTPPNFAEG